MWYSQLFKLFSESSEFISCDVKLKIINHFLRGYFVVDTLVPQNTWMPNVHIVYSTSHVDNPVSQLLFEAQKKKTIIVSSFELSYIYFLINS